MINHFVCFFFLSLCPLFFSWVFGEFLCKMYQFVHSLSYTASIFILMIICMERYFAIIYPITCKQILTSTRLRVSITAIFYYLFTTPVPASLHFIAFVAFVFKFEFVALQINSHKVRENDETH